MVKERPNSILNDLRRGQDEQMSDPLPSKPPKGQRDYSTVRLSYHALERFIERFHVPAPSAEKELRFVLRRTRKLGRNPQNGAHAILGVHRGRALVAILQGLSCLTVLTWPQFEPRMPEFGRTRLPRKRGRMLRRLVEPSSNGPLPTGSDLDQPS